MIKGEINSIKNLFLLKNYTIPMKRILSILSLLLFITACDDGDLTVDVIDFSEVAAQKCTSKDVIYKVKEDRMLVLEIPAATFAENETLDGVPIEIPINLTNKVTYRKYDGTVSADNICPTFPVATPNVIEEWRATDGIIQFTAKAIKTTNGTTNATKITGYLYNITFKNITFDKPGIDQTYPSFPFGNYTSTISPLAFGFDDQVTKSSCDNRIFNFSGSEAIILDVTDFAGLFPNSTTTTTTTALIDSSHKLTYKLFTNTVNDLYFCTTPTPQTPTLTQEWNAVAGVNTVSGIIEVINTTLSPGFLHTIHLKKVTLKKGNSDFTLGDDYILGSFITYP